MPEKVEKTVKSISCRQVPEKKCKDEPFFVPQKECKDFPREMCTQDPINVEKKVPIKVCSAVPMEKVNFSFVCNIVLCVKIDFSA